jgi:hypothetical protein
MDDMDDISSNASEGWYLRTLVEPDIRGDGLG